MSVTEELRIENGGCIPDDAAENDRSFTRLVKSEWRACGKDDRTCSKIGR